MSRIRSMRSHLLMTALLAPLSIAALGCSDGTPSVSSSTEEATVKGAVTILGKKVTKGSITFDPANVQRKMAGAVTAPIKEDGTFTIKTLVGENQVSFDLPEAARMGATIGYLRIPHEVTSGEGTANFDLPPKR